MTRNSASNAGSLGTARGSPQQHQQHQLRRQLDTMRRKMVKDRAQANTKIAALRTEKEALEKDCEARLAKITKSQKRAESGLATKVVGLEKELQKLRTQARVRAKRHQEQEKVGIACNVRCDVLRST